MKDIVITGAKSTIVKAFTRLLPKKAIIHRIHTDDIDEHLDSKCYLFCHGIIYSKRGYEQSIEEYNYSWQCNHFSIYDSINKIIKVNDVARICVIGSESAYGGSYDTTYARAKAELHLFVENKKLRTSRQQLVAISPSIIGDAGMTLRRLDKENLEKRREAHIKKRFLYSEEVARMVYTLLYAQPYINNTVIRMHGGI